MSLACITLENSRFPETRQSLRPLGIECVSSQSETTLMRDLQRGSADVCLVDVGWDHALEERLASWMECRWAADVPMLVASADLRPERVARLLSSGVDDVVQRSVNPVELAARLKAAVRRRGSRGSVGQLAVGGFVLQRANGQVLDRGTSIELTAREFRLAWLLFSNAGACVSRAHISMSVWEVSSDISERTLEQHVYRLRQKLRLGTLRGVTLKAEYGRGYRISVDEARLDEQARPSMPAPALGLVA